MVEVASLRCSLANVGLSRWWPRDARRRRRGRAPWWLLHARTPTAVVESTFFMMTRGRRGCGGFVLVDAVRCPGECNPVVVVAVKRAKKMMQSWTAGAAAVTGFLTRARRCQREYSGGRRLASRRDCARRWWFAWKRRLSEVGDPTRLCEKVVVCAEEAGRRRGDDGRRRRWRLQSVAAAECDDCEWVGVEEREGEIRVRICVGKEMMTWQTLIGDLS